jgi:hypothetical protein
LAQPLKAKPVAVVTLAEIKRVKPNDKVQLRNRRRQSPEDINIFVFSVSGIMEKCLLKQEIIISCSK